jgi:hypothetical protein
VRRAAIDSDPFHGCRVAKRFDCPSVYASTVAQDGWYPYLDTSDTMRGGTRLGGGLVFTTAATDNNSPTLQAGGTTGAMFAISKSAPRDLAAEFFFQVGTIVETGVLLGLGEEGMAANDGCLVDDTGAMASKDFVGFRGAMHAATLTISAVYRKAGQSEVVALTSALVPAINTRYSLGLRYWQRTKRLQWWVNGAMVKELDLNDTTAVPEAGFPLDEKLSPVVCIKAGEGVAKSLVLHNLDVYQHAA